jgi:tryptophan synthase alpha chain
VSAPASGAARIRDSFASTAADGRAAFIAYVLAGYRTLDESVAVARAVLDAGADLLEIGVPFSDPLADGPVIAEAGRSVVAAGGGLHTARDVVRQLRGAGCSQPVLLMTHRNPLWAEGDAVLAELSAEGVDGLIVPDLPAGEEPSFERRAADAGLALTFLVAPNTAPARMETVIRASTGFVYVVPRYGVTGARETLAEGTADLIAIVQRAAAGRAPIAAGFGVSTREQVAALSGSADGVIVGSVLVAAVSAAAPGTAANGVGMLVRDLARRQPQSGARRLTDRTLLH